MADNIKIQMESREVERLIQGLLNKVERPKPLLKNAQRWIKATTMKMFRGKRPDTSGVRGVMWPKLKESTIRAKKAKVKRGTAIVADRPMVETGKMRDSIKVLQESERGFLFGTRIKSKKNFDYPGFHNAGRFPFLFLNRQDFNQIVKMTVDYLKDKLKSAKFYVKG
jgi:hypothetical protein